MIAWGRILILGFPLPSHPVEFPFSLACQVVSWSWSQLVAGDILHVENPALLDICPQLVHQTYFRIMNFTGEAYLSLAMEAAIK